jgi:phage terminase small subunit
MGTTLLKNKKSGVSIDSLPQQMQAFVMAIMGQSLWNFAEAARTAGYKHAKIAANRLIHDPRVAAVLGREMRRRNERARMTALEIEAQVEYESFFDFIDLCDEDGFIVTDDLRKIPAEVRRCINGVEAIEIEHRDRDGNVTDVERKMKLKVIDKISAQNLLAKIRGMVNPTENNVTLNVGVVQQVLAERVEERGKSHLIKARIEQEKTK